MLDVFRIMMIMVMVFGIRIPPSEQLQHHLKELRVAFQNHGVDLEFKSVAGPQTPALYRSPHANTNSKDEFARCTAAVQRAASGTSRRTHSLQPKKQRTSESKLKPLVQASTFMLQFCRDRWGQLTATIVAATRRNRSSSGSLPKTRSTGNLNTPLLHGNVSRLSSLARLSTATGARPV